MGINARFWVFVNNDFVKVTLRPQQHMDWRQAHATEEGYHAESMELHFDGYTVERIDVSEGRDCDGELSYTTKMVTDLEHLQDEPGDAGFLSTPDRPQWLPGRTRVYDQYAQMAGY
jgi:hypothetical protein